MNDSKGNNSLYVVMRDQKIWSVVADHFKRDINLWRAIALFLGVFGAFLETLTTQMNKSQTGINSPLFLSLLGVVALAAAPILWKTKLGKGKIESWIRARSVSESLKKEMYLYLTRTIPYNDNDQDNLLLDNHDSLLEKVKDLEVYAAKIKTPKVKLPPPMNIETYLQKRVKSQIEQYYRPKARKYAKHLSIFQNIKFGLGLITAMIGAIAAYLQTNTSTVDNINIGVWVAVLTTASGVIATHIAAVRYEYLALSYRSTATRLESLFAKWEPKQPSVNSSGEEMAIIIKCEEAISIENQAWMTELLNIKESKQSIEKES